MAIDAINRHDLSKRKPDWLVNAAQSMARATKTGLGELSILPLAMAGAHHPHAA
jgi:hypothetical protein